MPYNNENALDDDALHAGADHLRLVTTRTSVPGQKLMSAFPPIATAGRTWREVRFVPIASPLRAAANGGLFDHLVGTGEQRWWNGEAECVGGLEIDVQIVLPNVFLAAI